MNNDNQIATPESVWAIMRENAQQIRELRESQAENARQIKEMQAGVSKLLKDTITDFNKEMKQTRRMTNGVSDSYSYFAEEYFFNSFEYGERNFFGEMFDKVEKNYRGNNPGEYDIMLINCKSVAIVEVKFRAKDKYIAEMFKKAKVFRQNFPEYKLHKLYLGLSAMVFDKNVENDCINNGIAVIKQVGGKVVISDEHMKVF